YAVGTYLVPDLMTGAVERLQSPDGSIRTAIEIPIAILVVFALRGIVEFWMVYRLSWVGRSVVRDLRNDLFRHYLGLPVAYYDRNSSVALISRLTYNAVQVAEATSNAIVVLLRDSLTVIGGLVWMIYPQPRLTVLVMIVGPIVGLLVAAMGRALRRYS